METSTGPRIYVFGCFGGSSQGHQVQGRAAREVPREVATACDCLPTRLPGVNRPEVEGEFVHAEVPGGWSYVTWWDRQGDSRGGSHTGLLARGTYTTSELLAAGWSQVPWAFRVRVQR